MCCEAPLRLCVIISAIARILLKTQDLHFSFSKMFVVILKNSDILFGSEYKYDIHIPHYLACEKLTLGLAFFALTIKDISIFLIHKHC